MNAVTRRLKLTHAIASIRDAVPDAEARDQVYSALYPILRQFDPDAVIDVVDLNPDLDPTYTAVLQHYEPWLTLQREIEP